MLFLLLGLFVSQSTAVLISSWDNCLTQSTQMLPNYTQLHPILVSASFDPRRQNTLRITIWGVVTGASSGDPAAGAKQRRYLDNGEELYNSKTINGVGLVNTTTQANATYFGKVFQTAFRFPSPSVNYSYTGEIIDQDKSWENVATTLNVEVDVSSFRVFTNATFFCTTNSDGVVHDNSAGAVCPFGNLVPYIGASMDEKTTDEKMMMRIPPVAVWDNVTYLTKDLRSFSWERRMPSRFQFSTMAVNLKIRAGNSGGTVVGCVNVEVTPEISKVLSSALTWVSAGILIFVGIATALAAMFNPWNGSTDLFRFSSNFGMDEDMLRMVTPGFADCLQWLQFIVLTGSLSVAYPGFYQPIVSHGAWSVLLVNTSLQSRDPIAAEAWKGDGIYALQQWTSGYQRLAQAVGLLTDNDIWVSVMVYFWSVTIGSVVVFQSWFWLRRAIWSITGVEEEDLTSRNWPFTIGG